MSFKDTYGDSLVAVMSLQRELHCCSAAPLNDAMTQCQGSLQVWGFSCLSFFHVMTFYMESDKRQFWDSAALLLTSNTGLDPIIGLQLIFDDQINVEKDPAFRFRIGISHMNSTLHSSSCGRHSQLHKSLFGKKYVFLAASSPGLCCCVGGFL